MYAEITQDLCEIEERGKPFLKRHYGRMKAYKIVKHGTTNTLVRRSTGLEVVKESELFDVIHSVHVGAGHPGRTKTIEQLKRKYSNVTRHQVELYLATCRTCEGKRPGHGPELFRSR